MTEKEFLSTIIAHNIRVTPILRTKQEIKDGKAPVYWTAALRSLADNGFQNITGFGEFEEGATPIQAVENLLKKMKDAK